MNIIQSIKKSIKKYPLLYRLLKRLLPYQRRVYIRTFPSRFLLRFLYVLKQFINPPKPSIDGTFAIHTVFILKENILFLEEWIDYHIQLGFNKFYLYDNSRCAVVGRWDIGNPYLIPGKINKYNYNYEEMLDLSDEQCNKIFQDLIEKYQCIDVIEWSPRDKDNKIYYGQELAHKHCLKRLKQDGIDWCANIDIDEFIVIKHFDNIKTYIDSLKNSITNLKLEHIRFDHRFNNMNKLVISITQYPTKLPYYPAYKNIYKVNKTIKMAVHVWLGIGSEKKPTLDEIWFNHYHIYQNHTTNASIDNIHPNIKKLVKQNAINYLLNDYKKTRFGKQ